MRKFLLPLLFLFLFVFESIFMQFLPGTIFQREWILAPHFLIAAILFFTIYGSERRGILYGLLFGLLFDVVYTEIIGIYLFLYPFVAYLVTKMMKVLQTNLFLASLMVVTGVALVELGSYEMNMLIHITSMNFITFVTIRLFPTLILNAIFILLAAFPLKRYFENFAKNLRAE
ncbi:rod shape-determining protein MreD [Neobacillus sp. SM06]|uniref:rod shape-determining protein MreD n=1 Tax=Neobacillus sp. SM06 TaxID=3422492 RepID=UPI003D284574